MAWQPFTEETEGLEYYEEGPPETTIRVLVDRDADSICIFAISDGHQVEASVLIDSEATEKDELDRGCRIAERLLLAATTDPVGSDIGLVARQILGSVGSGPNAKLVAEGYLSLYSAMEGEVRRRVMAALEGAG
jgi:hypothetical protein